jgi:Mg/Co/Ni transporter MgtE
MPSDRLDPLVLRFASARPDELASVLAGADPADIADLFGDLPVKSAATVATRLPSWQLTSLLSSLESEKIAQMLVAASIDDAVSMVSHLPESRYPAILESAGDAGRAELHQLFEYPSHSLASLATTAFIRVSAGTLCAAFCEQLSNSTDTRSRPVEDVASSVEALSGLTSAESALKSRLWMRFTELPVVDNRHRVLGVVSRAKLLRIAGDDSTDDFSFERLFTELATGYLNTCGRLLESVLGKR